MNFREEDEASFYRILLSDSEYLRLPSAFGEKYLEKGNNKKQTIVLQTKSCVEWRVIYLRIEDRCYFMGGWLKFRNENRLQVGDFLIFWLLSRNPNPIFQVFMYSPNGCLKHTTSCSGHLRQVKPTVGNSSDDAGLSEKVPRWLMIWKDVRKAKCYMHQMPLTRDFVKDAGIKGYDTLRLEIKKGKMWDVRLRKGKVNKTPHIGSGWFEFVKYNKVKVGDTCGFNHVQDNLLHVIWSRREEDITTRSQEPVKLSQRVIEFNFGQRCLTV